MDELMRPSTIAREIVPLVATVAGLACMALNWQTLPETVPLHFGLTGQPDGYGPKPLALTLPIVALFMYGMLTAGQIYGNPNLPWKLTENNKEQLVKLSEKLLWWMKILTSIMFAYVQYAVVETAMKRADGLGAWFAPVFIGSIFLSLALFFWKGNQIASRAA